MEGEKQLHSMHDCSAQIPYTMCSNLVDRVPSARPTVVLAQTGTHPRLTGAEKELSGIDLTVELPAFLNSIGKWNKG